MDAFLVRGGRRLQGAVEIGGAKNAALPILAAAVLVAGRTVIHRVPRLRDVTTMQRVLAHLGVRGGYASDDAESSHGHTFEVDASRITASEAPWDLVRQMRASVYVLGPLLARTGRARVALPGGCAWGPRPIDLHLKAMEALGAKIELEHGDIVASAPPGGLVGGRLTFDVSSVGATGNALLAAVLARGTTVIENAAREPDIVALIDFLNAAGARIEGKGSTTLEIHGVTALEPIEFTNIPDRIETGTYAAAAAITGGDVTLNGARADHCGIVLERLQEMGVKVESNSESIHLSAPTRLRAIDVTTQVYPGFPTDLQAQFMALLALSDGDGVVTEMIYPDRFTHVPELRRLGAKIRLQNNVAAVRGVNTFSGASVTSTDIRASSALVLAGLAGVGVTQIHRVYHIDRGYERIEERLRGIGADIERISAPGP